MRSKDRKLRIGRSPEKPHGLIASFGTQPCRAWHVKPPASSNIVEVSESDDDAEGRRNGDAAEQRVVAADLISSLLARIHDAADIGGDLTSSGDDVGGEDVTAPNWPGHGDRTAWAVTARAH